jgi:DNA invertase Pin-like site-specific DNA recombinase
MAKTKSDQKRLKPLALAYVRVSTEEQAKEGASLDAQQSLLADEASRRGWDVEFVVDEGLSAKSVEGRPALVDALERLDRGEADVLLTLRVDRLSRSVSDFAALLSRSRKRKWDLVACDLNIDTSTPHGGLMAHVLASVARAWSNADAKAFT